MDQYLFTLLRVQGKINYKIYTNYLRLQKSDACLFIYSIIESIEGLQNINLINPILEWVTFVYERLSGRIKFADAYEQSVDISIKKFFNGD